VRNEASVAFFISHEKLAEAVKPAMADLNHPEAHHPSAASKSAVTWRFVQLSQEQLASIIMPKPSSTCMAALAVGKLVPSCCRTRSMVMRGIIGNSSNRR
jgi:hypothetical protein